jgi:hypothetical protein
MPYCKNNPKKNYTGYEPSPKGLGYCASGELEGTKMKGKDGNMWIKKNGKWIKFVSFRQELNIKLKKWWQTLASGGIMIIYNNKTFKIITSNKKTIKAKINDIQKIHKEAGQDKNVKAIIWSPQSWDSFDGFIEFILTNIKKNKIQEIIKSSDPIQIIVTNFKKYFEEYPLLTNKDYTLKS